MEIYNVLNKMFTHFQGLIGVVSKLGVNIETCLGKIQSYRIQTLLCLVILSAGLSGTALAQIPLNLDIKLQADKTQAKVGDIVNYTLVITPSATDQTAHAVDVHTYGGFTNKRVLSKEAIGKVNISLLSLGVTNVQLGEVVEDETQRKGAFVLLSSPDGYPQYQARVTLTNNSISIDDLMLCRVSMWRDVAAGSPNVFTYGSYTFKFSATVLSSHSSAISTAQAITLRTERAAADNNYEIESPPVVFNYASAETSYTQVYIVPTLAPIANTIICDGTALNEKFASSDPAKPNPSVTTYEWSVSNVKNLSGVAAGSGAVLNNVPKLTDPTTSGSAVYTITPILTDNQLGVNGGYGDVVVTRGTPQAFNLIVRPVPTLTAIVATQYEPGLLVLSTTTNIKNPLYSWYDGSTLIATNTSGSLTLSNWQKNATDKTYRVLVRGNNYDVNGDLEQLACASSDKVITVKPLHVVLSVSVPTLKEGTSGKFILTLVDSDGNAQGFNKDETFTISLLPNNEAKPGHYNFPQGLQVQLKKMQTTVDIPVDALVDNIIYNTEVLRIQVNNDDLGTAVNAITLLDATADDPKNTIITLGSGTIYDDEQLMLHAKLPDGIIAGQDISISLLGDPTKSDISMLSPKPQISSPVIIKAGTSSDAFYVTTEPNVSVLPATLVINGTASGYKVKDGTVIILNRAVIIPNLFSPNGDPQNDKWVIKSIEKYPDYGIEVYDEWGKIIHATNSSNYQPWDGTDDKNGRAMPAATYYYRITLKMGYEIKKYAGYVALLR